MPGTPCPDVAQRRTWRGLSVTNAPKACTRQTYGWEIPPLLRVPSVDKAIFRPDWLHAADLGVSPRFFGNLFWHAIADRTHHYSQGPNQKARAQDRWRRFIQPYYEKEGVKYRLAGFGLNTVKQEKKGPNLGGTACCVKALVLFRGGESPPEACHV